MITIIVPVYNVCPYLNRCLQSIADQLYTDWECVLVDDGSTDSSGAICDEWAARDERFRVIHHSNKGVSFSRNYGLKISNGEYVVFVDSDDYVDSTYLSNLFREDADLVVSGYVRESKDGNIEVYRPMEDSIFDFNPQNEERIVEMLKKSLIFGPTNKLYKRKIIVDNGIEFPEERSYGEDLEFNFQYIYHVSSVRTIAKANYHYRIIGSGTLSSVNRLDAFENDYRHWRLVRALLENKGLWGKLAKQYMVKRLWGIVYDGLFSKTADYNRILSLPEISLLKEYSDLFQCSFWIKFCIINKVGFVFKWI